MTITKRKPGRPSLSISEREEIKDDIIRIAKQLFLEEGYESTSMRKIAAKAGFAPTKIYYYFENKKEILKHFWADISIDMWENSRPSEKEMLESPIDSIRKIMKNSIVYWMENPKNYRLLIETQDFSAGSEDNFDIYNTDGTKQYVATLMQLIEKCMQQGLFKQNNHQYVSQLLTMSCYGVYGAFYSMPSVNWINKQQLIDDAIDITLKGLLAK